MFELIMALAEMLNQLSLNTLTFPPIDLYKKKRTNQRQKKKKDRKCFLQCHVRHQSFKRTSRKN